MRILVVNAGSSSLKLRLLGHDNALTAGADLGAVDELADGELAAALEQMTPANFSSIRAAVDAVGHRIVHGGTLFTAATPIDARVTEQLRDLTDLAPLHQPKSLAALDIVGREFAHLPAIACFDTAFHHTLPAAASTYAVPREWRERYAVRRYGFHGLSHAYCSRRAAELLDRSSSGLRMVSCHLGAGASLAAVVDGRSVDTTMGFTPLDGLVMATRSGSLDPGLVLWLEEHVRLSSREVAEVLEHRSGLLALAGTGDMREVQKRSVAGDPDARLALDVFVHRLVTAIGSMAAATAGIDVLTFTGGVGEHSALVRERVTGRLAHLGIVIDRVRNDAATANADISSTHAAARTLVVTAREDLQIAAEVRRLLA